MNRVAPAFRAVFLQLYLPKLRWLAGGLVVSRLAVRADQRDRDPLGHEEKTSYSRTLVTMPAPTVRPPSRIAKRICSSRPTGVMSVIVIVMLSPGMTILVPSGNSQVPVTSVV